LPDLQAADGHIEAVGKSPVMRAVARYQASVISKNVLVVVDLNDGGTTVTNDAEAVVDDLSRTHSLRGRRIIYRDTEGVWDELQHDGRRFTGFGHIGAKDVDEALIAVGVNVKPMTVVVKELNAVLAKHQIDDQEALTLFSTLSATACVQHGIRRAQYLAVMGSAFDVAAQSWPSFERTKTQVHK
jgi:hypothetical protein